MQIQILARETWYFWALLNLLLGQHFFRQLSKTKLRFVIFFMLSFLTTCILIQKIYSEGVFCTRNACMTHTSYILESIMSVCIRFIKELKYFFIKSLNVEYPVQQTKNITSFHSFLHLMIFKTFEHKVCRQYISERNYMSGRPICCL